MGIFDFLKGNKKDNLTEVKRVSDLGVLNSAKIKVNEQIALLSEVEIQEYITMEINKRFTNETDEELDELKTDKLLKECALLVVSAQSGSTSMLQRRFNLGYNRARRIMNQLEQIGIVGPDLGSKARVVKLSNENQIDSLIENNGKVQSEKDLFFRNSVLPLHEDFIQMKVNELLTSQKELKDRELKEALKQQILEAENEKIEQENIRLLKKQLREELIKEGKIESLDESDLKRESIPQNIQDKVWNRDGGKCVKCGSQNKIEFDHIIPFSKGGSNTYRNLQILCEECNRKKSNSLG